MGQLGKTTMIFSVLVISDSEISNLENSKTETYPNIMKKMKTCEKVQWVNAHATKTRNLHSLHAMTASFSEIDIFKSQDYTL